MVLTQSLAQSGEVKKVRVIREEGRELFLGRTTNLLVRRPTTRDILSLAKGELTCLTIAMSKSRYVVVDLLVES